MNWIFRSGAVLSLAAMSGQAVAAPMLGTCISRAEFQAGVSFLMPEMLSSVVDHCKASLPADSFIATKGKDMLARYAYVSERHDPALNQLIAKIGPKMGDAKMDSVALKGVATAMLGGKLREVLKPKACADVSQMLGLLDPLPAENMYGMLEFILTKVDEGKQTKAARLKTPTKPMFCDASPPAVTVAGQ
jgi:hypothetical protein